MDFLQRIQSKKIFFGGGQGARVSEIFLLRIFFRGWGWGGWWGWWGWGLWGGAGDRVSNFFNKESKSKIKTRNVTQYVTDAPEGPLCATHLLIMLYLSVMFR